MSPKKTEPQVGRTHSDRVRKGGTPPRFKHGTRVAFNIVCARCGAEDTLPFVPKNTSEVLCSTCAREEYGEAWDKGRSGKPAEFEFACVACGDTDRVPFWPEDPEEPRLCSFCRLGLERPVHGRVDGEVLDARAGVRKRKG